jgi:predicted TIM-barrel fold metal-dependent hydrolase
MLPESTRVISVDDHVVEPRHVWQVHLPQKFRADGPRIVEREDGAECWLMEGELYPVSLMGSPVTRNFKEGARKDDFARRYDDTIPAAYEPKPRLEAMDIDGISVELNFPSSFPRFAGVRFLDIKDPDLALAVVQAYNDWMIDEWCATDPSRFIPVVLTPLWDPQLGAEEIRRTAAKGAKAISFPENPAPLGLASFWTDYWDPVFEAAQETGMPLCLHVGTSGSLRKTAPESSRPTEIALSGVCAMMSCADLIFSGIVERHPTIKIALSEGGSGWAAYLVERMDYTWHRTRFDVSTTLAPSEVFQRNFWTCFISDEAAVEARHRIGVDKLMFETDFPHNDSNYPHSRTLLEQVLADVPDDEARQIAELNARAVFDFYDAEGGAP